MPAIGVWELVVILVIVVIIFGAGRLSDVGGALGKGIREFRKATDDHPAVAPPVAQPAPLAQPALLVQSAPLEGPPLAGGGSVVAAVVVVENTCPSCATVNPTGQVFCGQCGTRLTRAA